MSQQDSEWRNERLLHPPGTAPESFSVIEPPLGEFIRAEVTPDDGIAVQRHPVIGYGHGRPVILRGGAPVICRDAFDLWPPDALGVVEEMAPIGAVHDDELEDRCWRSLEGGR